MKNMGVQLWSARETLKEDYRSGLKRIVDFGYTHVEPAGYGTVGVEQAKAMYDELGLAVESTHTKLPVGEDRDAVLHEMRVLACRDLIVSRARDLFATMEGARSVCAQLNEAAKVAAAEGLRVGYHNHWWEFHEIENSGTTGYDLLMGECDPQVFFQVDTYWVHMGGGDPIATMQQLGERCGYLHIKDGTATMGVPNVAIGEGVMDWSSVFAAAEKQAHIDTVYVEFDRCEGDIMDALSASARFLREGGYVNGR